jgi:hypothetical protein
LLSSSSIKKQSKIKIKQRRASDATFPSFSINLDLVCCHGNLAPAKGILGQKGRKRSIDSRCWKQLRRYFPEGPAYRINVNVSEECSVCQEKSQEKKHLLNEQKTALLQERKASYLSSSLQDLFSRKYGIPYFCSLNRSIGYEDYMLDDDGANDESRLIEGKVEELAFVQHLHIISPRQRSLSFPEEFYLPSSAAELNNQGTHFLFPSLGSCFFFFLLSFLASVFCLSQVKLQD